VIKFGMVTETGQEHFLVGQSSPHPKKWGPGIPKLFGIPAKAHMV